jgi:regulatory protein
VTDSEIRKKLLNKAGAILARRPHARGELRLKLLRHAAEPDVDGALDYLQDLNLLNDSEFAYNFASHRARVEGWGPLKIRQALLRCKVAPELVQNVVDRIRRDPANGPALREYVERRCRRMGLPADRKGVNRLVVHLRRRGYTEDSIWAVLRKLIPAAVWQHYESGD